MSFPKNEQLFLNYFIQRVSRKINPQFLERQKKLKKFQKPKRREQLLKIALKSFFNFLSKNHLLFKGNKFERRKFASKTILKEICLSLQMDFDLFLQQKYVDLNSYFIKGKNNSFLYLKSSTFHEHFRNYIKNQFKQEYVLKRGNKVHQLIHNFFLKSQMNYFKTDNHYFEFFFQNYKLKLPWSDQDLDSVVKYCSSLFNFK